MSDESERRTPEEVRRINEQCHGAPKLFSYPAPLPISEEERQQIQEINERLKGVGRRRRRRKGER